MSRRLALLVCAALAIVGVSLVAVQGVPAQTARRCSRRCRTVPAVSGGVARRRLLKAVDNPRLRRERHLTSLRRVLGPRWRRELAIADRGFLRQATTGIHHKKAKRHKHKKKHRRHGRHAGARAAVDREEFPIDKDNSTATQSASDTLNGRRGASMTRSLSLSTTAENCPSSKGEVAGKGDYSLTVRTFSPQPDGTTDVTTIKAAMHVNLWEGYTDASAGLANVIDTGLFAHEEFGDPMRVDTEHHVEDADGSEHGQTAHDDRYHYTYEGFPRPQEHPSQRLFGGHEAQKEINQIAEWLGDAAHENAMAAFTKAAAVWQHPGHCAKLVLYPETESLHPGQSDVVSEHLVSTRDGKDSQGTFDGTASANSRVAPPHVVSPAYGNLTGQMTFTAPPGPWTASNQPSLTVAGKGKAGVATPVTITFAPPLSRLEGDIPVQIHRSRDGTADGSGIDYDATTNLVLHLRLRLDLDQAKYGRTVWADDGSWVTGSGSSQATRTCNPGSGSESGSFSTPPSDFYFNVSRDPGDTDYSMGFDVLLPSQGDDTNEDCAIADPQDGAGTEEFVIQGGSPSDTGDWGVPTYDGAGTLTRIGMNLDAVQNDVHHTTIHATGELRPY